MLLISSNNLPLLKKRKKKETYNDLFGVVQSEYSEYFMNEYVQDKTNCSLTRFLLHMHRSVNKHLHIQSQLSAGTYNGK